MREIFKPAVRSAVKPLHGVYYTITAGDVGKSAPIVTTRGAIPVSEVLGRVMRHDVGKRIYAELSHDETYTVWRPESDDQRDRRIKGESSS